MVDLGPRPRTAPRAAPHGPLQPRLASPSALDPSLYLVTDTGLCAPRRVADVVAEAVAGGVTAVQVRDKHANDRDRLALVLAVRAALEAWPHVGLVVDDAVDVALCAGADGVHVGQHDLPPEAVRALVGPRVHVGQSAGTDAEIDAVLALPRGTVDLVGVGAVWPTATKAEASTGLGLERLAVLAARAQRGGLKAVAIGGIDASRSASVRASGVDGLCVVSAVCAAPDPRKAASRLVDPARAQR